MTTFCTFASGSTGNAALLACGETRLLIDMGISCRRVCQTLASLSLKPEDLTAVLITHEHSDHIKGLAVYTKKYATPIICTPGTARQLSYRTAGLDPLLRPAALWDTLRWPGVTVDLLPTSHDAGESAAFHITTPDGRVGYLTDTGYIPEKTAQRMLGADLLVLESNHDEDMLWNGRYPYHIKARIQGELGHLNNRDAARFAAASVQAGTRDVLLAHLSQENNTPRLALDTVGQALAGAAWDGSLSAAPCGAMSRTYCLERTPCCE